MAKATTSKTKTTTAGTTRSRSTSTSSSTSSGTATPAAKSAAGTAPKPASATAAASAAKSATVVNPARPVLTGPMMRKKELIERATERSGIKKKWVKPAIEAALAEMGEALANDRELNLPPFGKVRLQRTKQLTNAKVMVLKVRQNLATGDHGPTEEPPKDPLAEAAE